MKNKEEKEEEVKNLITQKSIELFLRYGIKRVTMDDIANNLGISKKTIYQHFKDKEEIISIATQRHMEYECNVMLGVSKKASNAVEHLFLISKCMRESFGYINSSILYDLKKYYKRAWEVYQKFENDVIYNEIENTLKKGIEEGYFREEIDVNILSKLRLYQIQMSFDQEFFSEKEYSILDVQTQLLEHFTYGILSEKGLKLFKQYKNQLIHEK